MICVYWEHSGTASCQLLHEGTDMTQLSNSYQTLIWAVVGITVKYENFQLHFPGDPKALDSTSEVCELRS